MEFRIINESEADILKEPIQALADYHNTIPSEVDITYPLAPIEETIDNIRKYLSTGTGKVMCVFDGNDPAGFAAVHIEGKKGWLDYLFVYEQYRSKGFGGRLMDWAVTELDNLGAELVQLKAVKGNPTQQMYRKYGFTTTTEVMTRKLK